MAVKKLLDKLITMESEPVKVAKLQTIKSIWIIESERSKAKLKATQKVTRAYEAYKATHEAEAQKTTRAYEAYKAINEAEAQKTTRAYEEFKEIKTAHFLEVLRVQGLNDTRGLFEYLQDKVLSLHQSTQGLEGSETTWSKVLQAHPTLVQCLERHLGKSCNLASHLATMYSTLSQHVGKDLSLYQGTIVFESDYLSSEQCASLVCLGTVVGVPCALAPRRHLTDMVSQT